MTDTEILRLKNNIELKMSKAFQTTVIDEKQFFVNKSGIPFRVCALPPNILVIEYADTWEDGDCFYLGDMTEEEMFNAMILEINNIQLIDFEIDFAILVPEEMKQRFERAGYLVETLSKSQSGLNDLALEEGGGFIVYFGNDGLFQYHPKGGIHGEAYWKIRNGTRGKHWYDTTGKEFVPGQGHK